MAEVGGGVTEGTICQEVHSEGSYWTGQEVQLEVAGHAGLLRIPRRLKAFIKAATRGKGFWLLWE